jgi:hypothetical protein
MVMTDSSLAMEIETEIVSASYYPFCIVQLLSNKQSHHDPLDNPLCSSGVGYIASHTLSRRSFDASCM